MRKVVATLVLMSAICVLNAEEWDDLAVVQVNALKPHATMMTFESAKAALKGSCEDTPWFKSLNGDWKFNWVKNPESRPVDFYKTDYDASSWKTIPVPSNWSKFGYGTPIYTNIRYPHPKKPPHAPRKYNPVGSYRTTFTVPNDWKGRRTIIHFAGVNSALYLWVNGEKVGYSSGSRTPAEFDITDKLVKGDNLLAVEVYRWHEGSYMEDQDFWRLAGIFRDVYLWSRDQVSIRDFEINTDLDEEYKNATLEVKVELEGKAKGYTVDVQLMDAKGKEVVSKVLAFESQDSGVKSQVLEPNLWNPERPYLYQMLLTLKKGRKVIEVIPWKVGFREVEIKGPEFMVNGIAVKMKGVNRHENDPDDWHYITRESVMKDIELMKQFNVNAVRTCHYPDDPLFYQLCDEYGVFVMDEVNIECHDDRRLSGNPDWVKLQMNRMERMAERDKNHASIIMWSLGNESGGGAGPEAMYKWLREKHADRPVHCEYNNRTADIESKMYANAWWGANANRPHVLCEYTHAMGNSNGNLKEYWNTIYNNKSHMGGFVWDWVDQGLRQPVPEEFKKNIGMGPVKDTFFAYGGWWEDKERRHTDKNFCMNGLVSSDRIPHPGLYALKYVHRNVHVTQVDLNGKFKIKNWFDYSNIKDLVSGTWEVTANGKRVADGKISDLDVEPHQEKEFSIALPKLNRSGSPDLLLTMSFKAKKDYSPLVPEGHELAWEQFALDKLHPVVPIDSKEGKVKVDEKDAIVTVNGSDFEAVFDKTKGLTSYTYKGKKMLDRGFAPDFWRSLTDNDRPARGKYTDEGKWRNSGRDHKIAKATVQELNTGVVSIKYDIIFPQVTGPYSITYNVFPDGELSVVVGYDPAGQNIKGPLRFGVEALVAGDMDQVKYYGRGPQPTYQDRKLERVGIFDTTVDDMWVDYSKPQENGNREDTRWATLTDKNGKGLLFAGDPLFNLSAKFYSQDTMWKSKYSFQMERSESIHLNIDGAQCGVGGDNSWGATPHPKYQLKNEKTSYSFRMIPIQSKSDLEKKLGK